MSRPLSEPFGISTAAQSMLDYLRQISRGEPNYTLSDRQLNQRCNVTPLDNFTLIDQLFEAGMIDYEYRGNGTESERHVRLVCGR
ncbi:MAG: hypothetical protein XXXJIFNMEKO3_01779 [Candidatus Erwinia impunctatus]|nr:hypothetical protein XXXJIFNMEKO_01779 [Culicoides impunctatus]